MYISRMMVLLHLEQLFVPPVKELQGDRPTEVVRPTYPPFFIPALARHFPVDRRVPMPQQSFPLYLLPVDLALEIVRIACSSSFNDTFLSTAAALSRVSYPLYKAAMPHLLQAVTLTQAKQVPAFMHSVQLQRQHRERSSRLALDYPALLKTFWVTECWEPLVDSALDRILDYGPLHDVMRNAEELALSANTVHLLYNGLSSTTSCSRAEGWKCRELIITGSGCRWNPLTSTREGQAFLAKLTHLTILVPLEADQIASVEEALKDPPQTSEIIPVFLANLAPIRHMPELRQLSFRISKPSSTPSSSCRHGTLVTYSSEGDPEHPGERLLRASVVQDTVFPSII